MDLTKHTPFPWYLHHDGMVIMSGKGKEIRAVAYASQPDSEIIISAVNNTYGKGVDPAKLDGVPDDGSGKKCLNCRHWRDKAWTDKGWGICDNQKNEVRVIGLNMIDRYIPDEAERKEVKDHFEDSIRYPEDFGCIFFEALEGS